MVLGEQSLTQLPDAVVVGLVVIEPLEEGKVEIVPSRQGGIDWRVQLHVVPGEDYLCHRSGHHKRNDALRLQGL